MIPRCSVLCILRLRDCLGLSLWFNSCVSNPEDLKAQWSNSLMNVQLTFKQIIGLVFVNHCHILSCICLWWILGIFEAKVVRWSIYELFAVSIPLHSRQIRFWNAVWIYKLLNWDLSIILLVDAWVKNDRYELSFHGEGFSTAPHWTPFGYKGEIWTLGLGAERVLLKYALVKLVDKESCLKLGHLSYGLGKDDLILLDCFFD